MAAHDPARLWSYAAGELSTVEEETVGQHVAGCADCQTELSRVVTTRQMLAAAAAAPTPPVQWKQVNEAVMGAAARHLADSSGPGFFPRLPYWLGAAAAAAVVALILFGKPPHAPVSVPPDSTVVASAIPPGGASAMEGALVEASVGATVQGDTSAAIGLGAGQRLAPGKTVRTPRDGLAQIALPDGSRLSLQGATEVLLRTARADEVAVDLVRGRIFVRASHAARREFVVGAPEGLFVRVAGTAFTVVAGESSVEVAVAEGSVVVESPHHDARNLATGGGLVFGSGAGSAPVPRALSASEWEVFGGLGVERPSAPLRRELPAGRSQLSPVAIPSEKRSAVHDPAVVGPPAPSPQPEPPPVASAENPDLRPPAPALPLPANSEDLLLHRAELSIRSGNCERFLHGLDELIEGSESMASRELARMLRARCFDDKLMPVEAETEYRKYLRDFPLGKFAAEATRAVAH
jgi:hypothetical protein